MPYIVLCLYVIIIYVMLFIYVLCYLYRTITLVATVICWPYPTLNKSYLILAYVNSPGDCHRCIPHLTTTCISGRSQGGRFLDKYGHNFQATSKGIWRKLFKLPLVLQDRFNQLLARVTRTVEWSSEWLPILNLHAWGEYWQLRLYVRADDVRDARAVMHAGIAN